MSVQGGKTGTKNIGQDIMKSAIEMANENNVMNGITVSMEAMFFMESNEDDEVGEHTSAKLSARLLETFMPDKKVAVHPEHHADIFATDMMTAPTYSADLFLCSNDLDNENFGDMEDFSKYRHFFSLISRPTTAAAIPAIMMGTMDRLTARPFGTSEATAMKIRVGHKNLRSLSLLALALNTPDHNWMKRLNRSNGKHFSSEPWAERTLKERLIANILTSGIDLEADRSPSEWASIFEQSCGFDMYDDDYLATTLDVGKSFVTFNHIAGENYESDFGTNLEIVKEMCQTVDNSIVQDHEEFWSKAGNAQRINALLDELSEIKLVASQINIARTSSHLPSYYIIHNGQKVGKVSVYSSGEDDGMSNSVLAVGDLNTWVADENMLSFETALMLKRNH